MNEEIDDEEFYHQDFTTASDWENFVARLEEILHEWKIQDSKTESFNLGWNIKSEEVNFCEVPFVLYQCHKIDDENEILFTPNESMKPEAAIECWYGLKNFLLLTMQRDVPVDKESQIKLLLSSLSIVIENTGCELPFFIQVRDKWQNCFRGLGESNGLRTNYEMVHLQKGPQHCKYLTGLIDMFKTKLQPNVIEEPVEISVQFAYNLFNWLKHSWWPDNDENSVTQFSFGTTMDPVNELILHTTWLNLHEHLVTDTESYTDFDPMQAPKWSIYVTLIDQPECLLSCSLFEFLELHDNTSPMVDIIGEYMNTTSDVVNAFDVLTESKIPTIPDVLKKARSDKKKSSKPSIPLEEEVLVSILFFLFPDAEENSENSYNIKATLKRDSTISVDMEAFSIENWCQNLKTSNPDSLLWRLCIVLGQTVSSLGGAKVVAYVWYEFVQELRYRWEKTILIPGVTIGKPDPRKCILFQKIQMLNCCIERKKAREDLEKKQADDSDEDSDEVFYDCDYDKPETIKPVGRLSKFGDLKLIKTGEPLYIPITQEPVSKTEDQLDEDTNVLMQLGSDEAGSELRARMMSASLLSDMESFKAANPESVLEDFIRWYSPRDWIEEDELDDYGQKKGHLSSRMQIPNNTWVENWESARPIPANRQKRLFDDTKEAEKVLHYLESRTLAQICELLLPTMTHAAVHKIWEEIQDLHEEIPETVVTLRNTIKNIERISHEPQLNMRKVTQICHDIANQELLISQMKSLKYKFDEENGEFISNLVLGNEIDVGNYSGRTGKKIIQMFSDAQKEIRMLQEPYEGDRDQKSIFPQPSKREFVMKAKTTQFNNDLQHMLRAVFTKNDFRLAGAFTEDILFTKYIK